MLIHTRRQSGCWSPATGIVHHIRMEAILQGWCQLLMNFGDPMGPQLSHYW